MLGGHALMIIGLTGKMCAGKNEVASILEKEGCYVIDVDLLGHEALSSNLDKLVLAFGSAILTDGKVDRKKLGPIVFSDKEKLKTLESISHPWMREETIKRAREAEKRGQVAVINAAILSRLELDSVSDEILFVDAPFELRAERAWLRSGVKREEFRKRDENQGDISCNFEKFCGRIVKILNVGDKSSLCRQVKDYYDTILERG